MQSKERKIPIYLDNETDRAHKTIEEKHKKIRTLAKEGALFGLERHL